MAHFEPNNRGLAAILLDPALYQPLERIADPIEARWKAGAAQHYRTGSYFRSIHKERGRSRDRVRVRVVADDEVSAILEARYHIAGRAVG